MRTRVWGKSVGSGAASMKGYLAHLRGALVAKRSIPLLVELVVSRLTPSGKRGRPSRPGSFSRPLARGTNRRRLRRADLAAFPILGAVIASANGLRIVARLPQRSSSQADVTVSQCLAGDPLHGRTCDEGETVMKKSYLKGQIRLSRTSSDSMSPGSASHRQGERLGVSGALLLGCALAGALLQGCDRRPVDADLIPAAVQQAMNADFPADGRIHVRSRGRLQLISNTVVCRVAATVDPGLNSARPVFPGLGIRGIRNFNLNENLKGVRCTNDGRNVVSYWQLVKNRDGNPYRLIHAIWQGDPANGGIMWVGAVERPNGKRPDVHDNPPFFGREFWERRSIELDVNDISSRLVSEFIDKGGT